MAMHSDSPRKGASNNGSARNTRVVRFDPPSAAKDYLSEAEWHRLAWHMHNENGPHGFSMYFIGKDDQPRVAASKTRRIDEAIQSTWLSMTEEVDQPFAAVPYPTSQVHTSTWACIDVDHHTHSTRDKEHAGWVVRKLSARLLRPKNSARHDIAWILESSGRGYHLFLLSFEQRNVKWWRRLMRAILAAAGLKEADGIEIYPPASGKPRGVRLPGSANPKTWNPAAGGYAVSRFIAVAGLKDLIAGLPVLFNKRGFSFLLKPEEQGQEKRSARGVDRPDHWSGHKDAARLLDRYAITAPSTRHNQLGCLVGDGFWHFGRQVLWLVAAEQHAQADPRCGSDLSVHRADFQDLYAGMLQTFTAGLNAGEREVYGRLMVENSRSAFVIVRNFARLAAKTGKYGADRSFPFSGQDLACRLQIGVRTAYNVRNRLIGLGFLEKVSECKPGIKAEYYRWLLAPMDVP